MRGLRFDVYYGYSDEGGPLDRIQLYFDVDEDVREIGDVIKRQVEDTVEELREGREDD